MGRGDDRHHRHSNADLPSSLPAMAASAAVAAAASAAAARDLEPKTPGGNSAGNASPGEYKGRAIHEASHRPLSGGDNPRTKAGKEEKGPQRSISRPGRTPRREQSSFSEAASKHKESITTIQTAERRCSVSEDHEHPADQPSTGGGDHDTLSQLPPRVHRAGPSSLSPPPPGVLRGSAQCSTRSSPSLPGVRSTSPSLRSIHGKPDASSASEGAAANGQSEPTAAAVAAAAQAAAAVAGATPASGTATSVSPKGGTRGVHAGSSATVATLGQAMPSGPGNQSSSNLQQARPSSQGLVRRSFGQGQGQAARGALGSSPSGGGSPGPMLGSNSKSPRAYLTTSHSGPALGSPKGN